MAYHHDDSLHTHQVRTKRARRIATVAVVLLLLGVGIIGVDWIISKINSSNTVVSSSANATVQSANINIFQSPYFRFQANESWREVTDQFSNPENEYIYRSYENGLIKHELWITVDKKKTYVLEKHYPTRVLPVSIVDGNRLSLLGPASDRCIKALPKEDSTFLDPHVVKQSGVSYFCHPNSTAYNVTVGVPGETNQLSMERTDGSKLPVTIIYKNVTATPDERQLNQILKTFTVI